MGRKCTVARGRGRGERKVDGGKKKGKGIPGKGKGAVKVKTLGDYMRGKKQQDEGDEVVGGFVILNGGRIFVTSLKVERCLGYSTY